MDLKKYECFVGTARGVIIYGIDNQKAISFQKPEDVSEITALSFGKEDQILLGYGNGNVSTFDPIQNIYVNKVTDLEGEGQIVGLYNLDKIILAAKHDGIINLWSKKKKNFFNLNLDEKGTLETFVLHTVRPNIVGTGGEYNDLKLWDLQTHQCIFKAKSQGHNMLNLPIPTSVRSITFLPENGNLTACCTKEGQVLLYDDKVQRRPVIKFVEKKASYTTITKTHRERQCLVGTTRGYMQLLDMRNGKCLKTFTSFTGSISSIHCDQFEPYVFTTSLDRFFRVHNLETKEMIHKIYMKQNLTKVLVRPSIKEENEKEEKTEAEEGTQEVDEEYEEIFRNMKTIGDESKRKRNDSETDKKKKRKKKTRKVVSDS